MKEESPKLWRKVHFIALGVALVMGVILGAVIFPTIREVPVVRIVEQRIEVPVDRVVEKRIEVPVDRVVEKIVEKRIEVPVEKTVIKYVSDRTKEVNGKPSYVISEERIKLWGQIKIGMTRQQVVGILGPPDSAPDVFSNGSVKFSWGQGYVIFDQISEGGLVFGFRLPEY
jgi:hypothetical protein